MDPGVQDAGDRLGRKLEALRPRGDAIATRLAMPYPGSRAPARNA